MRTAMLIVKLKMAAVVIGYLAMIGFGIYLLHKRRQEETQKDKIEELENRIKELEQKDENTHY